MYCGDETGSFIGDIGTWNSRFGYGGYDCPTYVVPSYVATTNKSLPNDASNKNNNDANNTNKKLKLDIKQRCIPSSCYNGKWLDTTNYTDFKTPYRMATSTSSSNSNESINNEHQNEQYQQQYQPIVDPNEFLQQGDNTINDWDAYEYMWQSAFDTLHVKDDLKHTFGGTSKSSSKSQQHSSGVTSTSITNNNKKQNTMVADGDGKCVHPIMVIVPGCTYSVGNNTNGTSSTNNTNTKEIQKLYSTITEIMMEKFNVSGLFIIPCPIPIGFSYGRQSCTVVDIGASGTRVTPIIDGLVLHQSQRRSGRGGSYLSNIQYHVLSTILQNQNSTSSNTNNSKRIRPRYELSTSYRTTITQQQQQQQSSSSSQQLSTYQHHPHHHGIFHRWAIDDLMYEFRTSKLIRSANDVQFLRNTTGSSDNTSSNTVPTLFSKPYAASSSVSTTTESELTPSSPTNDTSTSTISSWETSYELPDGTIIDLGTGGGLSNSTSSTSNNTYNNSWSNDIRSISELLFTDVVPFVDYNNNTTSNKYQLEHITLSNCTMPVQQLIKESIGSVGDVDIRKELLNNIVLSGSTTLLTGFDSRLSYELSTNTIPSYYKCKVLSTNGSTSTNSSSVGGGGGGNTSTTGSNNNNYNIVSTKNPASTIERSHSAWIGSSILSSLGSFQQLWLSRTEYDDYGVALSIQRFP